MMEKVLVVLLIVSGLQAKQQGASIQDKCSVNRTNIYCNKETQRNPLDYIDEDVSNVDTIEIHNAKIDFTDDIFKKDQKLSGVSLLNATDNTIKRIGRRGFEKMHNIQFLYLSRNEITDAQPDPFMSLKRLKVLQMNDAFAAKADKEELIRNIFHSKNDFVHLSEIELKNNELVDLHPKAFCGIEGLRRLELSNNKFTELEFARKCFADLKALHLSNNLITKLPADLWEWMPSLTSLDISNNPIHCDCGLHQLVRSDDISFLNQGNTLCASPEEVKGKSIFDLPKDFCAHDSENHTFFKTVVLLIIAGGVIFAYRKYRTRMAMEPKVVGYHNIEHEQAVQPEFV